MNKNVNLEAALGAMGFLGFCFVLALLGLVVAHALYVRKYGRARTGLSALVVWAGLYLCATLAFSLASREKVLARGEEKYFCEIDCHLAYSVADVRKAKTIGDPPDRATAEGEFYVVTVRTRFDEQTTAPWRDDRTLTPNSRATTLFDGRGREYGVSAAGQRALEASEGGGEPLATPLRPGEAYTTILVFDLPAGTRDPVLLINETMLETHFVVGHENSLLHGKTKFRLET